jgi:preprotein translocase subunit SecD
MSLITRALAALIATGIGSQMRHDPYVITSIRAALAKPGARLEYRLVDAESQATTRPRGAIRDSSSRRWLMLSDTVLVRLPDADSIRLRFGPTGGVVMFFPRPDAAERMLAATRRHQGQRMAILLNGVLLTAPGIAGEWAGRWGVAAGTDSTTGFALQTRLDQFLPTGGPRR